MNNVLFITRLIFLLLGLSAIREVHAQEQVHFKHLTVDDGLNSNHLQTITKDHDGYMWFGTATGLSKYDGKRFRVYHHDVLSSDGLPGNSVEEFFHGPDYSLWIKTSRGFCIYNKSTDSFISEIDSVLRSMRLPEDNLDQVWALTDKLFGFVYHDGSALLFNNGDSSIRQLPSDDVESLAADISGGNLFVVNQKGEIEVLNLKTFKSIKKFSSPVAHLNAANITYRMFLDEQSQLWLYGKNFPLGAFRYDIASENSVHFSRNSERFRLNNDNVNNIQEYQGRVWLGTDHGGINIVKGDSVFYSVNSQFQPSSLPFNATTTLYSDRRGTMWVGMYKGGVSYYNKEQTFVKTVQSHPGDKNSLPYDDVNCFLEDPKGNIWIGTNGGGLIKYNPITKSSTSFRFQQADSCSLSSNVVVSLHLDRNDRLWVGTFNGGLNEMMSEGVFMRYTDTALSNLSVWDIAEDSRGQLWLGTLSHGLLCFDRETKEFVPYLTKSGQRLPSTYYSKVFQDSKGNIWLGTAVGIEIIEADGDVRFIREGNTSAGLSNNLVTDILQDKYGRIWVSTQRGINIVEDSHIRWIKKEEGLIDEIVVELVEDDNGDIWAATEKGLSRIRINQNLDDLFINNFSKADGLQSLSFNENAGLKLRDGTLIFGGPKGFNLLNVKDIQHGADDFKLQVSQIQLNGRQVVPSDVYGQESFDFLNSDSTLHLSYNENSLIIRLTDFDYLHANRGKFQYLIRGLDERWVDLNVTDFTIYLSNLAASNYQVIGRYVNNQGVPEAEYRLMRLVVHPPWYKSKIAYVGYILLGLVFLYFLRRFEKLRERTRFNLLQAEQRAKHIRELDQLKTRFFTNVSHEFRTPISLILAPIESLMKMPAAGESHAFLTIIERNAKQLLTLVNQLLDFNKIDQGKQVVRNKYGNIIAVLASVVESFENLARTRQIKFTALLPDKEFRCYFDKEKIESVLFNLLSNALKFTQTHGEVTLLVTIEQSLPQLKIVVQDNGPGVSQENIERIFERYYQESKTTGVWKEGSGIGLSIAKEFVEIIGGDITLESAPGKGCRFIVEIPLGIQSGSEETKLESNLTKERKDAGFAMKKDNLQRILVVEDNADFAYYLHENLAKYYHVQICATAEKALEVIYQFHPDIIISDLSLPKISGIEFCQTIRKDKRTGHIPFIMITAVGSQEMQLEALRRGATDYLAKPFHMETFLSKIKSILAQKDEMTKRYKRQLDVRVGAVEIENEDEKFLLKATNFVESHLQDDALSVEYLARSLHITRVGLYKRILLLTGFTPTEFIRNIRLNISLDLLRNSHKTISEIAYEVGFGSPKQYSKHFKHFYGELPSHYRK
ncbi:MAG: hybrid sensor histidine kinase/response regulator transcription factor [Sphingobacterium sp.]